MAESPSHPEDGIFRLRAECSQSEERSLQLDEKLYCRASSFVKIDGGLEIKHGVSRRATRMVFAEGLGVRGLVPAKRAPLAKLRRPFSQNPMRSSIFQLEERYFQLGKGCLHVKRAFSKRSDCSDWIKDASNRNGKSERRSPRRLLTNSSWRLRFGRARRCVNSFSKIAGSGCRCAPAESISAAGVTRRRNPPDAPTSRIPKPCGSGWKSGIR